MHVSNFSHETTNRNSSNNFLKKPITCPHLLCCILLSIIVTNILVKPQLLCNVFAYVKYVKPQRQCPFCKVWQSRLSRHMSTVHKAEPQVTEALKPSTTSVERVHTCAELRKECIFTENMFQATVLYLHTNGKGKVRVICAAVPIVKASTAKSSSTNIKRSADLTLLMTPYLRFL